MGSGFGVSGSRVRWFSVYLKPQITYLFKDSYTEIFINVKEPLKGKFFRVQVGPGFNDSGSSLCWVQAVLVDKPVILSSVRGDPSKGDPSEPCVVYVWLF